MPLGCTIFRIPPDPTHRALPSEAALVRPNSTNTLDRPRRSHPMCHQSLQLIARFLSLKLVSNPHFSPGTYNKTVSTA